LILDFRATGEANGKDQIARCFARHRDQQLNKYNAELVIHFFGKESMRGFWVYRDAMTLALTCCAARPQERKENWFFEENRSPWICDYTYNYGDFYIAELLWVNVHLVEKPTFLVGIMFASNQGGQSWADNFHDLKTAFPEFGESIWIVSDQDPAFIQAAQRELPYVFVCLLV
jgi:hypothetical protein